jgi:hypothetical protein
VQGIILINKTNIKMSKSSSKLRVETFKVWLEEMKKRIKRKTQR